MEEDAGLPRILNPLLNHDLVVALHAANLKNGRVYEMSSLKFDLPQLDYTTRFALWQVKMRAILAQSSDLDEAIDAFGEKAKDTWTDAEKRKDRKALSLIQLHLSNNILQEVLQEKTTAELWVKLEEICLSKDLTGRLHVKMKLFSHKLQEGGSVMNHLSSWKEIVSDLQSIEVKYEDEDLGLLLLCSLPNSFSNFRDTILLSRDKLTLAEVYDALQQKEKMKSMVQAESSSSKAEALEVRGRPEQRDNYYHNNRDKSKGDRGRSKSKGRDKFCRYCKKSSHNIDDCWKLQNKEKRNGTYQPKNNDGNGKAAVVTGKGEAAVVAGNDSSDGDCLAVLAACVSRDDEWILDTACSFHICCNKDWFSSYESVQSGDFVRVGNDNQCSIVGIGSVQIKTHDGMTRTLTGVKHIPSMARNLISLSTLDCDGYKYKGGNKLLKHRIGVQVEHAKENENVVPETNNDDNDVPPSPPFVQRQGRSIAADRPRRNIAPPTRLIQECDIVDHALSCAEQVEHDIEPATYTEAIASVDKEKWVGAMQEEMQSLEKNGTWDVVHLPKQKKAVCKWIFKRKEGLSPNEPPRFKARLVAKGFSQIPGVDYNDVFSPVVKHSSIRAFFGIVAMHDLELEQLDVKTAFLHGELEEEIYMDQPEGYVVPGKEDLVCKLKRSLYGLKQSPRQWYKSVRMSSRDHLGGRPPPGLDSSSADTSFHLALGSVPCSLLLPPTTGVSPQFLLAWSPEADAVPTTAEAMAAGDPDADPAPPRLGNTMDVPRDHDAQRQDAAPPLPKIGAPRRSPGTAFLDSVLSKFHSCVASALGGSCSFARFWITPPSLSPSYNKSRVASALNFRFTSFPDAFIVHFHGGAIFSALAASPTVRELILATSSVRMGSSVFRLHRTAAAAAAVVATLPAWPPC
ncbi:hypothetical protein QYE76_000529 [Lolium multiflorum]|uniref:Reverse transcriptase Ty1/copia-type domain-containing protein n=1 Tax=Lolium multiflorum TaxID=4521 RepID=A0AAD8RJI7_LOLMU|nr:hypothetical protein QYE76_000529 [Lolium multiflorum]